MNKKVVYLRGHHLLCILNWKGCGYTPDFTRNYDSLINTIMIHGAPIQIIEGPDDICSALDQDTYKEYHCDCAEQYEMDEKAIRGLNSYFKKNNIPIWKKGEDIFLNRDILKMLRQAFKSGDIRQGCEGCSFYDFCTDIAQNDFKDTRLKLK